MEYEDNINASTEAAFLLHRNLHDLRWTYVAVMYHVTMETADICSKHRPEKLVTLTSACAHTYIHIHILRASRTGNCQEKSESTSSSFSGILTPRLLSEGLNI